MEVCIAATKPPEGKKRCDYQVIKVRFFPREAQSLWLHYPALSSAAALS